MRVLAGIVLLLIVEIVVVVLVASWIGIGWTLLILLASGMLGAVLVRREGLKAFRSFRTMAAEGTPPGRPVIEGVLVALGGLLVIFPGFVSDVLALLCLLPPTRRLLFRAVSAWALREGRAGVIRVRSTRGPAPGPTPPPAAPRPGLVIEGEVVEGRLTPPEDTDPPPGGTTPPRHG